MRTGAPETPRSPLGAGRLPCTPPPGGESARFFGGVVKSYGAASERVIAVVGGMVTSGPSIRTRSSAPLWGLTTSRTIWVSDAGDHLSRTRMLCAVDNADRRP